MKWTWGTGIHWVVEVAQHQKGATSLLKLQMLVGSVFGFLMVVMVGVAFADDIPTSNPNPVTQTGAEVELAPAVVVAAGADSINTNAIGRVIASSPAGIQNGTVFQLNDGRMASVTHALDGAADISLVRGTDVEMVDSSLLQSSRLHDLTSIPETRFAESLPVAELPGEIGQGVALAGIPESGRIEVVAGEIIGREDGVAFGIGRPDVYVISAEVSPGWSGGPVVNASGEVIAVIVGREQVTGVTLAVPIEYLPDI